MGTSGAEIFDDDLACDVRAEYEDLIADGKSAKQATARIIREHRFEIADDDDGPVFWLALAATQLSFGQLLPNVRDNALHVIESGEDLRAWQETGNLLPERQEVLAALRKDLLSPPSTPRKPAGPFLDTNDWPSGLVVAYRLQAGQLCLMRVVASHHDTTGVSPVVEFLDWEGSAIPDVEELSHFQVRHEFATGNPIQLMIASASRGEFPENRIQMLNVSQAPSPPTERYAVTLWRLLDHYLAENLGLR